MKKASKNEAPCGKRCPSQEVGHKTPNGKVHGEEWECGCFCRTIEQLNNVNPIVSGLRCDGEEFNVAEWIGKQDARD